MSGRDKRKAFTYLWTLENFSLSSSIRYSTNVFHATNLCNWKLELICFGGRDNFDPFKLEVKCFEGPEMKFDAEFSLLASDGSILCNVYDTRMFRQFSSQTFKVSEDDGTKILDRLASPSKIVIRYRMWKNNKELLESKTLFFRTLINVKDHVDFVCCVNNFSSLQPHEGTTIYSLDKVMQVRSVEFRLLLDGPDRKNIAVAVFFHRYDNPFSMNKFDSKFKVSILDGTGNVLEYTEVEMHDSNLLIQFQSLTRQKLLHEKDIYLPGDSLIFSFEGIISGGICEDPENVIVQSSLNVDTIYQNSHCCQTDSQRQTDSQYHQTNSQCCLS